MRGFWAIMNAVYSSRFQQHNSKDTSAAETPVFPPSSLPLHRPSDFLHHEPSYHSLPALEDPRSHDSTFDQPS
ncbi:uncharacterized protein K441DRAFT_665701 [Cenococcum geophilum 1.58]|uniref:uncharacterized protein n=1 Tax=Cenococcum geophilum 1.58 TaxID=794803 RepID=UPI00358F7F7C|nr:hypothetical protein K441DRAFT_665701 [Cenococcum geophilum 1.58]